MANTYKMTNRDIQQLILLRASNAAIFTGRKNSALRGWRAIKRELGLQGLMSARQLKKKWDNLNQKYKVIKNPPEGENPKNPAAWPWFYLMDDAVSGRLDNAAKVIELLPIDDEKHEADLPYRPCSDSEEIISALNVEMAPIESEEDVEMIDKSGNYEEGTKKPDETAPQAPKITVKRLESVPTMPKNTQTKTEPNTQPSLLYATLLPDSTASVASKVPTTSAQSIVVQAKPVNNTSTQNGQPTTVLYATLLPDSTATTSNSGTRNCLASNRNIALEVAELNKKLLEYKREKKVLEKEQAEFDKELINLESEREQLNRERQALDLEKIENERDRALLDKNRANLEREKAGVERDKVLLDRDRAYLERDRAIFERDKIFLDKAKEDFERQKDTIRDQTTAPASGVEKGRNDGVATEGEERMDVTEKHNDLTDKVLEILTADGDQEETRHRFATLVKKLCEKM
ncbi:uncharacterized protein LOC110158692 [Boleophthalmus pectinirostris]|uniref:uncharacterized protein LOC110158692 n=1 Tax=Boleophthalmus pectinirostris TaxID=150288 RepID=UPI002430994E|nr:uncharacterized protein LOC110158692 [Boleophthalmus pectinirostris]